MGERTIFSWIVLGLVLIGLIIDGPSLLSQENEEKKIKIIIPDEPPHLMISGEVERLSVSSSVEWTDSGYDVLAGQEISFSAQGAISLQQGNPIAYCGPDGKTLNTIQQPLKDWPIGALIGRIVQLISIEVDEETGEETRNEVIELFYIGAAASVSMPLDGRLFLGVNETVVEDNDGVFSVTYISR
jgi:hypothetical protein